MEISQQEEILVAAKTRVEEIYREQIDDKFVYHDFEHTKSVVKAAQAILTQYDLSDDEQIIVELACWFHDTGYTEGQPGHEERSAAFAVEFMEARQMSQKWISKVKACIMATRPPQSPQTELEKIVCDADLAHLGMDSYWDRCGRVRQELVLTRELVMSEQDWVDWELKFIQDHTYHTTAANALFKKRKDKHIRNLIKRKRRLHPGESMTPVRKDNMQLQKKKKKGRKNRKKKKLTALDGEDLELKKLNLGRGVETMFRTTYRTHVNLSNIADNKANIMLSINAIIISIIVTNLVPRLDSEPELRLPTVLLILVCLVSLVFAILSTRPKVTEGRFTREDIEKKRSNLLFFGNFYNMNIDDFHWGMLEMIKDSDFLYSSMTRDLYYLGIVLAKKYRFLRICYTVFMYGLIVSVIAFAIAHTFAAPH